MKKFFILLAMIPVLSLQAQSVIHEKGKAGLIDASGKTLLPTSYDEITSFVQFGKPSPFYICRNLGMYGIYSVTDQYSTGCIYDSVYSSYNILYLRKDSLVGYVAQTINTYKIIEPQYVFLFPICDNAHVSPASLYGMRDHKLAAKKDSLWGVVSFADGREVIACKYRHEVTRRDDDLLWVSEDGENGTEILINPQTGAEFPSSWMSKRQVNSAKTYLLVYDHFTRKEEGIQLTVFNFATGQVMWSYLSQADQLLAEFESESILYIREEFQSGKKFLADSKIHYSFYNVTNGALLLKHEGVWDSCIDIVPIENKLVIYVSESFNGKKKLIGEIYK